MLFGLFAFLNDEKAAAPDRIVVTTAQIANLQETFGRTWQRPPSPEELRGLIDDYVRDEVSYREAQALGLERNDIVIRRRLRQKIEFMAEEMAEVRPDDAVLTAYLAAHANEFRTDDAISFRHVFLSAARESIGDEDVRRMGAVLVNFKDDGAALPGDAFLLGDTFKGLSKDQVARTFGDGFAERLFTLAPGRWQGPVPSSYGLHFVFVDERAEGALPPLEEVRPAVEREWANARRVENLDEFHRLLAERYQIVIEAPPGSPEPQAQSARADP